jgi:hypothetical protein
LEVGFGGYASYIAQYEASDICQLLDSLGFHDIHITSAFDKRREFMCLTGKKLTSS